MASLLEYYAKDGSSNLRASEQWPISHPDGTKFGEITASIHLDFEANAKFLSFFIPIMNGVECPELLLLNQLERILKLPEEKVSMSSGFGSGDMIEGKDLLFTGRIFFYSERPVTPELKDNILTQTKPNGLSIVFRSVEYMEHRNRLEKPLAFISHDSRDKATIAGPLAIQLQKFMCPVWYDEFSLKIGDSLREEIEKGLKECPKCILILTPNFLSNDGWSKTEYDSIFTRERVEKQKIILPVWHDVSQKDVFNYSPILADKVAAQWSKGVDEVARNLVRSLQS